MSLVLPRWQQAIRDKCFHPSGTFVEFPKSEIEQSIPARFEKIVRDYPERIAVKTKSHTLTYLDLDRAANRMACRIIAACGSEPEPIVALIDHDADAIATILGVLKTGKTCVPLDPAYQQNRVASIVVDCQAKAIVTKSKNLSRAFEFAHNDQLVVNLDDDNAARSADDLRVPISPDTAAYILHTSGSTGQPKGVVQNHRNLLHDVMGFTNEFHICAADRLTLFASTSGGQGLKTMLNALLNGAAVCMWNVKQEGLIGLNHWILDERISIFNSGPTFLVSFMKTLESENAFPDLRLIILTGEPTSAACVALYKKHFHSKSLLVNMFGSLETGQIGFYAIANQTTIPDAVVPVGYPTQDKEVLILGDAGNEVDSNIVGEIAVKSRYLAPGYWRQPDLTAAKFICDPEGGDKRVYLTGDLGFRNRDGCLVHKGRRDFRVKIRGYAVDITEVEEALKEHVEIKSAVVIADAANATDAQLVAYFTSSNKNRPRVNELRVWLRAKLPDYAIPSVFVKLDVIPIAPNGKVERKALPEPDHSRPNLETLFVAPNSNTEKKIAEIWSDVLDIVPVGIDDNFFDLGGQSLLAAKLFARLDQALGRSLPLSVLFEAPTIRALAERYEASEVGEKASVLVALRSSDTLPPIYAVPGVFGNAISYAGLSRALEAEQPFFGFNAIGLDAAEAPLESIEAIARRNIIEIHSVHRNGPYALIGACFGAVVAYEMARQLTEAGEEVAFLGLLDPLRLGETAVCTDSVQASWAYNRLRALVNLLTERLRLYREDMRGLSAQGRLSYLANKLHSLHGLIGHDNRFASVARELYQLEVYQANQRAFRLYQRKPIAGRLRTLEIFESSHPRNLAVSGPDWVGMWEGVVIRHSVPGKDSGDMVSTENARVLAPLLAERIRKAIESPLCQHEVHRASSPTG